MMRESIEKFNTQFLWEPEIKNAGGFKKYRKFIIAGMGGSGHTGNLVKLFRPEADIIVHRNYGLPKLAKGVFKNRLFIASSYSGNTEEVLDALHTAGANGMPRAVIASGGELLRIAETERLPYVKITDTTIQPRMGMGFGVRGLLKLMGDERMLKKTKRLSKSLKPRKLELHGKELAERLRDSVPLVYSSSANWILAYIWKITLNETAKIPAFCSVLPEANHNETTGFDVADTTRDLSKQFCCLFLRDNDDHPRIQKRMSATESLYKEKGVRGESIQLEGKDRIHKAFSAVVLAAWTSLYLAEHYGVEAEEVPMVEEFKKLIA